MAVIKTVQEESLVALGDAIREKAGTTEPLVFPTGMIEAIGAIEAGGGDLPEEAFMITGNCQYRFSAGGWDWFLNKYGNQITTKDITDCQYMFTQSGMEEIPFDINISESSFNGSFASMFSFSEFTQLPLIKGQLPTPTSNYGKNPTMQYFIYSCKNLREIPYDYFDNFGGEEFWAAAKTYTANRSNFCASCSSLRKLPDMRKIITSTTTSSASLYYNLCGMCYVLDEIINIPVSPAILTSNCFSNFAKDTYRVKNILFATQEDGTPSAANWKNQTIDLSKNIGRTSNPSSITSNNSGITKDKEVQTEEQYQALKNDPDWWTQLNSRCRYNHDSAVATINSLPDCSASGGTNTIKFEGANGSKTDGGAINTLTEEEIAVATAKGWTVSFI